MNKRALKILEYNKIIEMLSNEAGSQMAKDRIARFSPRGDVLLVRDLLSETTEAAEVIIKKGTLPIGELYDTEPLLYRVRKGGALTMKQLLMILYNMKITENVVSFLNKDLPHLSVIHGKAEVLVTFPKLRDKISTPSSIPSGCSKSPAYLPPSVWRRLPQICPCGSESLRNTAIRTMRMTILKNIQFC